MNIKQRKILILPTVILIMAIMIGFSAAWWRENLIINGDITTGTFTPELSLPYGQWYDNEEIKDVGTVEAEIIGPPFDTIVITIENAYPCYEAWVAIGVHHIGSVPQIIESITWDDAPPELEIWLTQYPNNPWPIVGTQIHNCIEVFFYLHIHVFEDDTAEPPILPLPDTTYTFTVTITCVQYNYFD